MNRLLMLLGPVLAIILYIMLAYSGWESAPAGFVLNLAGVVVNSIVSYLFFS